MSQPRFSIVIPTRERARTLHFAIRSCLAQKFDDYEIVVCDNCGSPDTRQVVESFGTPKIKYVRSDVPLAMSDNWELAVSHARGEYITVLGDDDALMRHALVEAQRLIRVFKTPLLRWSWAFYKWPDYEPPSDANRLYFPLSGQAHRVRSRQVIKQLLREPRRYHDLPMIYNSLVHRELLDKLRARTGRVFNASSPDVYSGFALAQLTRDFVSVSRPMGICGTSSHSNGHASVYGYAAKSGIAQEFTSFNAQSGLDWNQAVPEVAKSISAVIAESYAQSVANLSGEIRFSSGQRRVLVGAILHDLWHHPNLTSAERAAAVDRIRPWCAVDGPLKAWFDATASEYSQRTPAAKESADYWLKGLGSEGFDIDASHFGVSDADAAADLIEKLLGCLARPVRIYRRKPLTIRTVIQTVLPASLYRMLAGNLAAPQFRKAS